MSKIKYTHQLAELVFDALLKVFNRKSTFLRYIHSKFGDKIYFNDQETKRQLLNRIYQSIINTDQGKKAIVNIALEISSYSDFPDLKGFEDSEMKIKNAKESVNSLKKYIKLNMDEVNQEENKRHIIEKARIENEKLQANRASLSKFEKDLYELAQIIGTQSAGYKFEKWFFEFVDFFEVQCRRPYKTADNRQIDGSISINGTDYIVELKFTKEQISVDQLDSLQSKLRSKADNTLALCISMSGFTENAKNNASIGRTMILLLDFNHINLVLRSMLSFSELIERLKRHASQTGESYLDASKI